MELKTKCPDAWGELLDIPGNRDECPYLICSIPENLDIPECEVTWNKLLHGCDHECYSSRIPDVLKAHFDKILAELNAVDPDGSFSNVDVCNYLESKEES